MANVRINGPVAALALALVLILLLIWGNRATSPPQTLGPAAQQMREGMRRAHPEMFK